MPTWSENGIELELHNYQKFANIEAITEDFEHSK